MKTKSVILIIFGISGDLSKRFLLPALEEIAKAEMLPEHFQIVGITRQKNIDINSLLEKAPNKKYLKEHLSLYQMDVERIDDYKKLDEYLKEIENNFQLKIKTETKRLFYLSIPPQASKNLIELLGQSKLSKIGETKLLLEKPFGTNLKNALILAKHIDQYFDNDQVYRVDHYMAKENAQNIIVFREGNSLFKKTWNKDFIESIEITASEQIDIENRVNFYENTGALRDYVQSHLLQLLALTMMELPEKIEDVPASREKILKSLNIVCDIKKKECVKRGQYIGYRKEVANENSLTETFVSINLQSNDPSWAGVPITLTTGKALKNKFTEIKIKYKKDREEESNILLFRIQPNAGIEFDIWTKIPGYENKKNKQKLDFHFKEYYEKLPEAYEQVLFNAINSDHSLFTSSGEVLETWRVLNEVQESWEGGGDDLIFYKKGSSIEEIMNM